MSSSLFPEKHRAANRLDPPEVAADKIHQKIVPQLFRSSVLRFLIRSFANRFTHLHF